MAIDQDLDEALRSIQQVISSPQFIALASDRDKLAQCQEDPLGSLRASGITLPAPIRKVEMKRRHTSKMAWNAGLRGGGMEWRFYIQAPNTTFRSSFIIDHAPFDDPATHEELTPRG